MKTMTGGSPKYMSTIIYEGKTFWVVLMLPQSAAKTVKDLDTTHKLMNIIGVINNCKDIKWTNDFRRFTPINKIQITVTKG